MSDWKRLVPWLEVAVLGVGLVVFGLAAASKG